jgi:hypothetical protein
MYPARYSTHAIDRIQTLRDAGGYAPRWAVVPDESRVAIPARRTYEAQLWLPPGSILWAVRGVSEQPEGFRLQVTDAGTGERFFQTPMRFDPAASDAIPGQLHLLTEPRQVLEPGLVTVQVTNLSASDNDVQVILCYAQPLYRVATAAAAELERQAEIIRRLRQSGRLRTGEGGSSFIDTPGLPPSLQPPSDPPYLIMPANGVPFRENAAVVTPAPGSQAVVVSFIVPTGFDGVLKALSNQYNHSSFFEGSGDIVWRIAVDGAYVKGYDRITTTIGTAAQPQEIQGAIRVYSGQKVEYIVEHAAGSGLPTEGTNVICTMSGWFYPRS